MKYCTITNIFTAFLIFIICYFAWCFYDFNRKIVDIRVGKVVVESGIDTNVIKSKHDTVPESITVSPGDTVHVEYILTRYRTAIAISERIFEDYEDKTFHTSTAMRIIDYNQLGENQKNVGQFRIPLLSREGCNNEIYTKIYYDLFFNIMTFMKPILVESPRVSVCVDGNSPLKLVR